jgi:hypothetical protein
MPFQSQCNKIQPSKIYITSSINNQGSEDDYTTNKEADHNQDWGGELLHIIEIIQQIVVEDLPTNMLKNDQHYYVNMVQSLTMIEK